MESLLNSNNEHPKRDLRLLQELLAIYQISPKSVESLYEELSATFNGNLSMEVFDYKLLINMIVKNLPGYCGNISGRMDISKRIDGTALSDILKIILSKPIKIDQAIANIEVALGIPPKNKDLFGFVLYEGMALPEEIVERLKSQEMEFEYGIVGSYKKIVHSKSLRKLVLEDERSFDPSLEAAFAVTWGISDAFYQDGSNLRPFVVWTSTAFLTEPFIMPPVKELLTKIEASDIKTYKRELTIPR